MIVKDEFAAGEGTHGNRAKIWVTLISSRWQINDFSADQMLAESASQFCGQDQLVDGGPKWRRGAAEFGGAGLVKVSEG